MPVLLQFPGDDDPGWAARGAREEAREELAETMRALAPMTTVSRLPAPDTGFPGVRVSRRAVGPVSLIEWGGFDYCQTATAKTTEGVPEGISLSIRPFGHWALSQSGITRCGDTGDALSVVDVTQAMRVELGADAWLWQMFFSAEQLGLPFDDIRAAATVIERSPLRPLVMSHILSMSAQDLELLPAEALRGLGQATVELVRAMLIAASQPDAQSGSEVSASSLRHAIKQYIRLHLHDPGLCPRVIAQAHQISVRYLHQLWQDENMSVSRSIARQRLEAARQDLADPRLAGKTIAAIGREWGFPSAAHFARRFREAYAVSPRDWRETSERP